MGDIASLLPHQGVYQCFLETKIGEVSASGYVNVVAAPEPLPFPSNLVVRGVTSNTVELQWTSNITARTNSPGTEIESINGHSSYVQKRSVEGENAVNGQSSESSVVFIIFYGKAGLAYCRKFVYVTIELMSYWCVIGQYYCIVCSFHKQYKLSDLMNLFFYISFYSFAKEYFLRRLRRGRLFSGRRKLSRKITASAAWDKVYNEGSSPVHWVYFLC